MIREATLEDIPALLEMGERFSQVAGLADHVGYDPESMAQTFRVMIEAPAHVVFVSERGAIGAMSGPHPFNYAHRAAQEVFWWSAGGDGLKLLNALLRWSEGRCDSLSMITLEAVEPERTGRLYERLGFRPVERSFIKVF